MLTAAGVELLCEGGSLGGTIYPHGKVEVKVLYNGCVVVEQKEACHFYENLSDAELDENRSSIGATAIGLVTKPEGFEWHREEALSVS